MYVRIGMVALILYIAGCRSYNSATVEDKSPFDGAMLNRSTVIGVNFTSTRALHDFGPELGIWVSACSRNPEISNACVYMMERAKSSKAYGAEYDRILQGGFPESKGSDGYIIVSPTEMTVTLDRSWGFAQAPVLLLPMIVGVPHSIVSCRVGLRASVVSPTGRLEKTLTASDSGWAAAALYWGYRANHLDPDITLAACSKALLLAMDDLKQKLKSDRQ